MINLILPALLATTGMNTVDCPCPDPYAYTLGFDEEFDGTISDLTANDEYIISAIDMHQQPFPYPYDLPLDTFAPGILTDPTDSSDGELWVKDIHMTLDTSTSAAETMQSGSIKRELPVGVSDFDFWTKVRYGQPETDWSDLQYLRCNLVDAEGKYVASFQLLDGYTGQGMRARALTDDQILYDTAPSENYNQDLGRFRGFVVHIARDTSGYISFRIRSSDSPTTVESHLWAQDYYGTTTVANNTEIHAVELVFQRARNYTDVGVFAVDYLSFHGSIANHCDITDNQGPCDDSGPHPNIMDLDDLRCFIECFGTGDDLSDITYFISTYLAGCS